jgi:hypothetical protein
MRRACLVAALLAASLCAALAHEVRPAYLELRQTGQETYDALWKVPGRGEDLRLALYVQLPAGSINQTEPRSSFVNNAFIERWTVKRPGGLAGEDIRIVGLDATLTDALVRLERLDGSVQVARLTPASPSFVVSEAPSRAQVALTYLKLGIEHILLGFDHLLFVLALILVVRGRRAVVLSVTAFTLAHSITLALATFGVVSPARAPIEATIALSIAFMAAEAIKLQRSGPSLTAKWPWVVAFTFGLLHGFGFAGALSEIGLPHGEVPLALFMFNAGVEIGQLMFIAAIFAVRELGRLTHVQEAAPTYARPLVTYGIGCLAAYWLFERLSDFST